MPRIFLIVILLAIVSSTSFSQHSLIDSAYTLINQRADKDAQAEQIRIMGIELKNDGNYGGALILYTHALQLFQELHNLDGQANCLNNLGIVHWRMGDRVKATECYLASARLNDSTRNTLGLAKNQINLGNLYASYNDYRKAVNSFNAAKENLALLKDTSELTALTAMNIGNLYSDLDNDEYDAQLAKNNYKIALQRFESLEDTFHIAGIYNNFGLIAENANKLDSALFYYTLALRLRSSIKDYGGLVISYLNIGNICKKQKKYEAAMQHYHQGLQLAKEAGDAINYLYLLKNQLSLSLEITGQGAASAQFADYEDLKDSIFNVEKSRQIAEIETKYETERKEREILEGKAALRQKSIQNKNLIAGLILTVFATGLIIILIMQRNRMMKIVSKRNDLLYNQQINQLLKEQELKTFDALMEGQEKERIRIAEDLHDRLGSTLTAARLHFEAMKINSNTKAFELLDNAIDETRQIAHNMQSGVLMKFGLYAALHDLKETIESSNQLAVHIQTIQFDNRLTPEQEVNLYRIAQECISNILKHAGASLAQITVERAENRLAMTIEDNGSGFDISGITPGIGLKNLASRAAKINGEFTIESAAGKGTKVSITMQV